MKLDQVTEAELSLLQILWSHGEATTRSLAALLYAEVTDPKLASVQKLLERLEAKGCVSRDRQHRPHRFRPRVSSERFLQSRLQAVANRLCGGHLGPLVSTLIRSEEISPAERTALRELVEKLWADEPPRDAS